MPTCCRGGSCLHSAVMDTLGVALRRCFCFSARLDRGGYRWFVCTSTDGAAIRRRTDILERKFDFRSDILSLYGSFDKYSFIQQCKESAKKRKSDTIQAIRNSESKILDEVKTRVERSGLCANDHECEDVSRLIADLILYTAELVVQEAEVPFGN